MAQLGKCMPQTPLTSQIYARNDVIPARFWCKCVQPWKKRAADIAPSWGQWPPCRGYSERAAAFFFHGCSTATKPGAGVFQIKAKWNKVPHTWLLECRFAFSMIYGGWWRVKPRGFKYQCQGVLRGLLKNVLAQDNLGSSPTLIRILLEKLT